MSAAQKQFIVDLGRFIAEAETAVPDIAAVKANFESHISQQKGELERQQEKLEQIRQNISNFEDEARNIKLFADALGKTIERVTAFPVQVQAQLAAARAERARLLRQKSNKKEGKEGSQVLQKTWHRHNNPEVRFSEVYDVQVKKTSSFLGLCLENDGFGVRIAEVEPSLKQGACESEFHPPSFFQKTDCLGHFLKSVATSSQNYNPCSTPINSTG